MDEAGAGRDAGLGNLRRRVVVVGLDRGGIVGAAGGVGGGRKMHDGMRILEERPQIDRTHIRFVEAIAADRRQLEQ